jgi:hypothetical protein
MKKFMFVLLVTLFCGVVLGENVIERESRGVGRSRSEAIKQALYDAVSQAKGVAVSSGNVSVDLDSSTVGVDVDGGDRTVSVDAVAIRGEGTSLKTRAAGMVKSYEVLSESEVGGKYEVNLKVLVYVYKTPLASNRKRLAVMPLRSMATGYDFLGLRTSAPEMEKLMSKKLVSLLTQTNQFSILDRDHIEEFAFEQKILLSDAASVKEKAKLSEIMGCDYMLVGTIRRANIKKWSESSKAIGRTINEYEGDFVFEYRVIAAATSQVWVSDEIVLSLDNEQVKGLSERWRPKRLDLKEMRDNLVTMAAKEVLHGIVDSLFPVKVVKVSTTGAVILNQGGKRFAKGDIYEIFGKGEVLTNPDTGEKLGVEEIRFAQIEVIHSTNSITYAEVVRGDASLIKRGMVCRYQKRSKIARPDYKESKIEKTGGGGVKLPFD